jgi:predicted NodU family carbamoyl transferase
MTVVLGISAYYRDLVAVLVVDMQIIAANREQRFARKKHDLPLPVHAMDQYPREPNSRLETA